MAGSFDYGWTASRTTSWKLDAPATTSLSESCSKSAVRPLLQVDKAAMGHKKPSPPPEAIIRDAQVTEIPAGMTFANMDLLRSSVGRFALRYGINMKTTKSEPSRFQARCVTPGCNWSIRATSLQSKVSWIRDIIRECLCFRTQQRVPSSETRVPQGEPPLPQGHPEVSPQSTSSKAVVLSTSSS